MTGLQSGTPLKEKLGFYPGYLEPSVFPTLAAPLGVDLHQCNDRYNFSLDVSNPRYFQLWPHPWAWTYISVMTAIIFPGCLEPSVFPTLAASLGVDLCQCIAIIFPWMSRAAGIFAMFAGPQEAWDNGTHCTSSHLLSRSPRVQLLGCAL